LVARSGGSIAEALASMREVVWDKGPVRCGTVQKADGAQAPRFHDSEVAAIGFALQEVLAKRGFLDAAGNQVPVAVLGGQNARGEMSASPEPTAQSSDAVPAASLATRGGKKCPECGAHAMHKSDGCWRCGNCLHLGSCG
jgi:ribonucleoside-diphosphate reductase alpha chain